MKKLQVWWIPQMPMKAFEVDVETVAEGVKLMKILADYDLFQLENNIKPDYANIGGLNQWSEDCDGEGNPGWESWNDEETGGGCSLEFTNGADSLDYAGCDVYLRPPIESQDQVEWMQNIDAAMKEPLFNELRALMGTENNGQDIALLQTIRRYRRKTLQAQGRWNQEPTAFPDLPSGVVKHAELSDLFDRMQMHQYAMKYAMANNAAQAKPVEKQEPVDDLEDLLEEYWNLAYNEGKNKRVRGDGKTLDKIRALFSAKQQPCPEGEKLKSEHAKSEAAWATGIDAAPSKEKACSTHPDAPHGFDRTASHSLGRYVCICEGWEPSA